MKEIKIIKAKSNDLVSVLEFIQIRYLRSFGTKPNHVAENCFVATKGDDLVGILAVEFFEGHPFEIEKYFELDFSFLPFPREKAVCYSRWISDIPSVAPALAYAAIKFAIEKGRTHSFSCATADLMSHLQRRYKFPIDKFFVPIRVDEIPEHDRNFFLQEKKPGLYVGILKTCLGVLEGKISTTIEIL